MEAVPLRRRARAPVLLGVPPRRLDIAVFGPVRISANGREIAFKSRRARAVLAYIALADGCSATRERLCGLFWGDASTKQAQNSLRQIVRELNVALDAAGYHGLRCTRLALSLDPATLRVDVWDVLTELRQGLVHPLLLNIPRVNETLFSGFDDFEGVFDTWLRGRQQTMHDQLMRELDTAINMQGATPAMRKRLGEAMVNLDPANEAACRALMQARAEAGDAAGALRAYESLRRLLAQEHGVPPADLTVALLEDIKSGRYDPPAPPDPVFDPIAHDDLLDGAHVQGEVTLPAALARPVGIGRIGVRVALFACDGIPDDRAHLVGGFRHDLIACLIRFRDWYITDAAGRGTEGPPPLYLVAATAHATEDRVHLSVTLQEADARAYIWSDRIDIPLADWFPVQHALVGRLAAAISQAVAKERALAALAAPAGTVPSAYDLWRRGQILLHQYRPEDWNAALALFEAAMRAAPDFAPAYTSMVQMNNVVHLVHPGVMRDPPRLARALAAARKAVALDHHDSRAVAALGWTLANNKRFDEAAHNMRVALDLNRNDIWTLMGVAQFHAYTGNATQARDLARQSFDLVPVALPAHWIYQAIITLLGGDDEACLIACDHAGETLPAISAFRAAALAQLGRIGPAQEAAARFCARARAHWFGPEPPTDAAIGRWLLHMLPISRPEIWDRWRQGVLAAGIPDGGLRFGQW